MVEVEVHRGAQVGIAGQAQQFLHPLFLLRHIEQVAHALLFGTAGAADAVGVMFVLTGHIVVDHGIHIRNIDAAGGNVGGYQNGQLAVPEVLHDLVALLLGEVAVQAVHREAQPCQLVSQSGSVELGIAEHHHTLVVLTNDDLCKVGKLVAAGGLQHILDDLGLAFFLGLDGDLLGVVLVQPADVHYLAADGGREHGEGLAGLHHFNDMPHILIEAHVQHFVGLVQHDLGHMGDINGMVLVVVHQTARRCHHDLAALGKALCLLFHVGTAVHAGHLHFGHEIGQLFQLLRDLLGQLPGGGHDHGLRVLVFR